MFIDFLPADSQLVIEQFGESQIGMFVGRLVLSLPSKAELLLTACASYVVYKITGYFKNKVNHNGFHKIDVAVLLLAALFAFSMVFGQILDNTDARLLDILTGTSQWIKIIVGMTSWIVVSYMMFYLIGSTELNASNMSTADQTIDRILDFTPVIFIICWVPFLLSTAPGLMMGDTSTQIKQFFGYENSISSSVDLISPDILITQHHPVLHTLLVGICMQIGKLIVGSYSAGYMVYTILQLTTCIMTLSFGMRYLKHCEVPASVRLFVLILMLIVPWFVGTALLGTKDGLFCCAAVLFVIALDNIARNRKVTVKSFLGLFTSAIFVSLLRSGAIIAVVISLALFLFVSIKIKNKTVNNKRTCITVGSTLIGVTLIYFIMTSLLFPSFGISGGSPREMLSIPIQQVSAIVKYHEDDISAEEKDTIDSVLDYDVLAEKYNPDIADGTKNTWRKDATDTDKSDFIAVWLDMVIRHPMTALEATMRNYYGYLYPSEKPLGMYSSTWSDTVIQNGKLDVLFGFSTNRNDLQKAGTCTFDTWLRAFEHIPVLSIFSSTAFYVWAMLVSLVIAFKKMSPTCYGLAFLLFIFLIVLIGPCNGTIYYRYILPLMFTLPFMVPLTFSKTS